jgi:hypothetical protein
MPGGVLDHPPYLNDEVCNRLNPFAGHQIRKNEGPLSGHSECVRFHDPKDRPARGAGSILLITRKSERVIPGPALRGTFLARPASFRGRAFAKEFASRNVA